MKRFWKAAVLLVFLATACKLSPDAVSVDAPLDEPEEARPVFIANYIPQPSTAFSLYEKPADRKGIYVTANRVGSNAHFPQLLELCRTTELNAMVIDVKTDDGFVTFKNGIPLADELGLVVNYIPDIRGLMDTLRENQIYPIARIVCFKDNGVVGIHPEWYIHNQDGSVWQDNAKSAWINPYNRESWDYILEIAAGAARVGFQEIQFDYIRFATAGSLGDADLGETGDLSRVEIITAFTEYAMDTLKPLGVSVSADVYGTIIGSPVDADIVGQDYVELAKRLDIICPMVYPSHYANPSMGIDFPDLSPYETIYRAMQLSSEKLEGLEKAAVVRPWLQDFTATWLKPYLVYGGAERRAQIQAVYDAGYTEWLLWDGSVNYDEEGLMPKEPEAGAASGR